MAVAGTFGCRVMSKKWGEQAAAVVCLRYLGKHDGRRVTSSHPSKGQTTSYMSAAGATSSSARADTADRCDHDDEVTVVASTAAAAAGRVSAEDCDARQSQGETAADTKTRHNDGDHGAVNAASSKQDSSNATTNAGLHIAALDVNDVT